jgi:hypothetical protein
MNQQCRMEKGLQYQASSPHFSQITVHSKEWGFSGFLTRNVIVRITV